MARLKEALECERKVMIRNLLNAGGKQDKKGLLFSQAGKEVAQQYAEGNLNAFHEYFENAYQEVSFPFEWSFNAEVKKDSFKWERTMKYLFSKGQIVGSYLPVKTELGNIEIPFVLKEGTATHIYMLRSKKMSGYLSMRARKPENKPENSPLMALVKAAVLDTYPDAVIHVLGMTSADDTLDTLVEELSNKDDVFHSFGEFHSRDGLLTHAMKCADAAKQGISCADCPYERVYCHPVKFSEPVKEDAVKSSDKQYTSEQVAAIKADGKVLVSACPGSGKTATVVGKVRYLLSNGVEPDKVVVLTFSNAAAEELRERIADKGVVVSTIHSYCLDILRTVDDQIGVETTSARYRILADTLQRKQIKGVNSRNLYDPLTGSIVRLDKCIQSLRAGANPKYGSFEETEVKALQEEYEATRKERDIVSFDEILIRTKELLESRPGIARMMKMRHPYLIIDEFQDVDEVQFAVIKALTGDHLLLVGDADQNIYEFRGASSKHLLEFKNAFPDGQMLALSTDFRSSREIVEIAGNLISHNENRFPILLEGTFNHEPVSFVEKTDGYAVEQVDVLLKKGYSLGDIAIIARTNDECKKAYAQLGADRSRLNRSILVDDPIFNVILAVLKLSCDEDDVSSRLRLICLLGDGLENNMISSGAKLDEVPQYQELFDRVDALIERIEEITSVKEVFQEIAEEFFHVSENLVLNELLLYLEESNVKTVRGALGMLANMEEVREDKRVVYPRDNRVTILTAHDSKGLEFPAVILSDLGQYDRTEEGRRLLYVAITRAMKSLTICYNAEQMEILSDQMKIFEELVRPSQSLSKVG